MNDTKPRLWLPDLVERLDMAIKTLKWYATADYPDDGSGRPPEAYQRRAKETLDVIEEK